jgi:caffeoyl-CoA O-methyltransferase
MSRTHTVLTDPLAAYLREITLHEPEALRRLRESTEDHPRASMQTSPEQGQFLHVLARILGAKQTLEVGVFMGYSSTWVALALPANGRIVACDVSEEYATRARQTWRESGVEGKINLHLRPAVETLDKLIAEGSEGEFDFAFIDADKSNYANYYERALALLRPGGVVAIDNVLWDGEVIDETIQDPDTVAIRAFNRKLHADQRVAITLVPLGDGLTLACKL